MNEDDRLRILTGDINGVETSLPPKTIVLYVSSVGPDTVEERTALTQNVFPAVREHCRTKYGLEFLAIDLKWGVPEEFFWPDHSLPQFARHQLLSCRQMSFIAPIFASILGQRYGTILAPRDLPETDFGAIVAALKRHPGRETRDWPLLEGCYARDDNSIPAIYRLRHVDNLVKVAGPTVMETLKELGRLLRKGSEYCFYDGVFDSAAFARYVTSEQHKEIETASEIWDNFADESLHFARTIIDLKNYIEDDMTPTYIELDVNKADELEIDENAEQLRDELQEYIRTRVSEASFLKFEILWRYDGVVNPKHHTKYLHDFQKAFYDRLIYMIEIKVSDFLPINAENSQLLEVKQHWTRCREMVAEFEGRKAELGRLQAYVTTASNQPLIVHGQSGVGKSTLLSKFALQTGLSVGHRYWTVLRYLGMTSSCGDIYQLLESLSKQISELLGRPPVRPSTDIGELIRSFQTLLHDIPRSVTIVMILDGLDEMNGESHRYNWIPMTLPNNVKFIISTHSQRFDVLKKLQNVFFGDYFLQVCNLHLSQSEVLLSSIINKQSRSLTAEQWDQLSPILKQCGNPLFLSLLSNICVEIASDVNLLELNIPNSLDDLLTMFFTDLETRHGTSLVSHSMAYLIASHGGLGDNEMQDILSLDDTVLDESLTYQSKIRRIPPLCWAGLKFSLRRVLFQYEKDEVMVSNFSSHSLIDYLKSRYLSTQEDKMRTHSILAGYFLGKWHDADGLLAISAENQARNRYVASQPLAFTADGDKPRFNKRKLSQVPRHLYLSENIHELRKMVLFNYKWMYNKMSALSLLSVMGDLQSFPCEETRLVEDALRASRYIIEKDVNNMAVEITGRLLSYYPWRENIRCLIQQCDRDGLVQNGVLPTFSYTSVPGSMYEHTIAATDEKIIDTFASYRNNQIIFMKHKNTSSVYKCNLSSGLVENKISASCGDLLVTPDGMFLVIVDHATDKTIKIHLADSGRFIGQLIVMNYIHILPKEKFRMGNIVISNDRLCTIVSADTSFLCIADIPTCRFLQIVQLYNRSDICVFSTNCRLIYCNAAQYLLTYDVYTLQHISSTSLAHRPCLATTSRDDTRVFVCSDVENKVYVLHVYEGRTELTYKIVLSDILLNDAIVHMKVSNSDRLLLIRAQHNIIVYDREEQNVTISFSRPKDVPTEFKMPRGSYTPLHFTQADFSNDDRHILGAIFRNVYIWDIATGDVISNIQTPVGIIDHMFVNKRSHQIVTHCEQTNEIHTWKISKTVNQLNYPDYLTSPVNRISISANQRYSFATCDDSDELGVVDMFTGGFVDLLTHGGNVVSFAPSADGKYVMVSLDTDKPQTKTRLWDLNNREVMKEFGNAHGLCLSFKNSIGFVLISQNEVQFSAPYYVTQYLIVEGEVEETVFVEPVCHLLQTPFITDDDRYLVILTSHDYDRHADVYCEPYIVLIDLQKDESKHVITTETFTGVANIKTIIDVRCCTSAPRSIAIFYILHNLEFGDHLHNYGFMIMDIDERIVKVICEPFLHPGVAINENLLFSDDFEFCVDDNSDIYTINRGYLRCIENHPGVPPRLLVLHDSAVAYSQESTFYVVRLLDNKLIARVDIHSPITAMTMARDSRTIVIGCQNGSVLSYVLIDPDYDDVERVISQVGSRRLIPKGQGFYKYWDKISDAHKQYSRPPSASGEDREDAIQLDVNDDNEGRQNVKVGQCQFIPKSTTCAVM